jgi:hypothetical protein
MATPSAAPTPAVTSLPPNAEALLEFYKEHLVHGRHIEVQRSTIAGVAFALSGAIIGELLKKGQLTTEQLPFTVTLLCVGLFACLMSAKLYERFRLHNATARLARNQLDPTLQQLRKQAQDENRKKYPLMFRLRLHVVWNSLFGIVLALGLITTVMCLLGSEEMRRIARIWF